MKHPRMTKTKWHPNVTVEAWFSIHPELRKRWKQFGLCCCCDNRLTPRDPFVSGDYVGVRADGCCGMGELTVFCRRSI